MCGVLHPREECAELLSYINESLSDVAGDVADVQQKKRQIRRNDALVDGRETVEKDGANGTRGAIFE